MKDWRMALNLLKHIAQGSISILAFLALVSVITLCFYAVVISYRLDLKDKDIVCIKKSDFKKQEGEDNKKIEEELNKILDKQSFDNKLLNLGLKGCANEYYWKNQTGDF